ncbi:glutathione S-transferase N-terminal domain-containing protein [uncultured Ruegeria sp.]|uniref:glutathione S-transferase N-terminal domain-containing protein n=1 Tax=uncultured Ruegeria sp. TaxID=259304 RepID=UPI0026367E6C|nr:glutathione S-transferase N-terminal domain-containing protein [uncultured Ruegeria sp.]
MKTREQKRRLFEVIGENPQTHLSPYCWRSRMALAHKRLKFVSEPWHVTEKQRIARSGGVTAPVLVDGGKWVRDSWQIASYLEESYPDYPLFDGVAGKAKALFVNRWADNALHPLIFRAVIAEQFPLTAGCDKAFYEERTQRKFEQSVEEIGADPEAARQAVVQALGPLEDTLVEVSFLGGGTPDYADYILFGTFQWVRVVSHTPFWSEGSALHRWFEALLDAFDGMGRAQPPRCML